MKLIRQILSFLLVPVIAYGQTVHIDEDRIVYKGTVNVANTSQAELYSRAKEAMNNVNIKKDEKLPENNDKAVIVAKGNFRLETPYHLIRTIAFVFEITVEEGQYKYRIDSVYMEQKERGGEKTKIPSEKLVKGAEATGPEAISAEKILNEIDMNFQKLLALVNADMKKTAVTTSVRGSR